jgi:type IVB pilus formation R64 PilN family outer membrane protein
MISALSTQGRVSELTSATLVTLNNQAAPVNVGRRVSYLAASATTQTPNVGSTTSLTPGTVQTGFSMTLVPHILGAKEMLLQYSLDLSTLLELKSITSGTSTIQTPDVSTSNFIQRVRIQTGETLVVAGFDQDNLLAVADGVGSAQNSLMGQRKGMVKRTMLVILIQPNLSL